MLHSVPAGVVSAAYSSFTVGAATFDGGDGLKRDAPGLSGHSDGKEWALSYWFNLSDEDAATHVFLTIRASSSNKFLIQRSSNSSANGQTANGIAIVGRTAANGLIMFIQTTNAFTTSTNSGWNHILASGNMGTDAKHIYVNGSSVLQSSPDGNGQGYVFSDGDLDFTGTFEIGRSLEITSLPFYGELAEFWFDDSFIDFSSSTNREKFYSSGGDAVDLGSDGSTPTGSSPLMYLHLDSGETGNNFASNAGTGGDLSVSAGALTNAGGLD